MDRVLQYFFFRFAKAWYLNLMWFIPLQFYKAN